MSSLCGTGLLRLGTAALRPCPESEERWRCRDAPGSCSKPDSSADSIPGGGPVFLGAKADPTPRYLELAAEYWEMARMYWARSKALGSGQFF